MLHSKECQASYLPFWRSCSSILPLDMAEWRDTTKVEYDSSPYKHLVAHWWVSRKKRGYTRANARLRGDIHKGERLIWVVFSPLIIVRKRLLGSVEHVIWALVIRDLTYSTQVQFFFKDTHICYFLRSSSNQCIWPSTMSIWISNFWSRTTSQCTINSPLVLLRRHSVSNPPMPQPRASFIKTYRHQSKGTLTSTLSIETASVYYRTYVSQCHR